MKRFPKEQSPNETINRVLIEMDL